MMTTKERILISCLCYFPVIVEWIPEMVLGVFFKLRILGFKLSILFLGFFSFFFFWFFVMSFAAATKFT